jgi:lipid-A-disaccharide synthase
MSKKNILIITGEVSGDMQASLLVQKVLEKNSNYNFFAVGGKYLKDLDVKIISNITSKASIGYYEKFFQTIIFYKTKQIIKKCIENNNIDLIIFVDYLEMNTKIAKCASKKNIKTVYYIPPQEWGWTSDKRAKELIKNITEIICIFENEYNYYKKISSKIAYFGHPLIDKVNDYKSNNQKITIDLPSSFVAIFPGSRKQEIKYILPEILRIISDCQKQKDSITFIINIPNNNHLDLIKKFLLEHNLTIKIYIDYAYPILEKCKFALVTSGTICLEATLFKKNHIVFYKFNNLIYFFLQKSLNVIKKRYKFFSITNIVAKEKIINEYMQKIPIKEIVENILFLFENNEELTKIEKSLDKVIELLKPKEISSPLEEIANYLLE